MFPLYKNDGKALVSLSKYQKKSLNKLINSIFGLEIVCGDERCTFLLKKPENWKQKDVQFIYEESLSNYFKKISQYLEKTDNNYRKYKYFSVYYWKNIFSFILNKIGLKKIIKKILNI